MKLDIKNRNYIKILNNNYVKYNYFIERNIEAGIALKGWEVKSFYLNQVRINNSYIVLKHGEAYLLGAMFKSSIFSYCENNKEELRDRKLLLNKYEINSLVGKINNRSYTIIVVSMYKKNTWIKLNIGIAKGKKQYDKRLSLKERAWKIQKRRILKRNFI